MINDQLKQLAKNHKCKNCYWYYKTDEEKGLCERVPLHVLKSPDSKCIYYFNLEIGDFEGQWKSIKMQIRADALNDSLSKKARK